MIDDVFELPDGADANITTSEYHCHTCGTFAYNVTYRATASNEWGNDNGGRLRRKFYFHKGKNPVCNCHNFIWLSSDKNDAYRCEIFEKESIVQKLFGYK